MGDRNGPEHALVPKVSPISIFASELKEQSAVQANSAKNFLLSEVFILISMNNICLNGNKIMDV